MQTAQIRPRFQVRKLEGTYTAKIAKYVKVLDPDTDEPTGAKRLEYEEVERPRGWMVFFPNGSSVHITNEEELKRMGYAQAPELVDLESGDVVGSTDLETRSERKTRAGRGANLAAVK